MPQLISTVLKTSKIKPLLNQNPSASGDFVPQTPTDTQPLDPAGGLPSPRPSDEPPCQLLDPCLHWIYATLCLVD